MQGFHDFSLLKRHYKKYLHYLHYLHLPAPPPHDNDYEFYSFLRAGRLAEKSNVIFLKVNGFFLKINGFSKNPVGLPANVFWTHPPRQVQVVQVILAFEWQYHLETPALLP